MLLALMFGAVLSLNVPDAALETSQIDEEFNVDAGGISTLDDAPEVEPHGLHSFLRRRMNHIYSHRISYRYPHCGCTCCVNGRCASNEACASYTWIAGVVVGFIVLLNVVIWGRICYRRRVVRLRGQLAPRSGGRGTAMPAIPSPSTAGGTATRTCGTPAVATSMPVAQPVPAQMLQVVCPDGVAAGQSIQVQGPSGMMMATVPSGVAPGQVFAVAMPAAPPPVQAVVVNAVAVEMNKV